MTSCPDCPYRLWPCYCEAESTGHRRHCQQKARPEWSTLLYSLTMGQSGPIAADPIAAAVDACPFAEGCTCNGSRRCYLASFPVPVELEICRVCPVAIESLGVSS